MTQSGESADIYRTDRRERRIRERRFGAVHQARFTTTLRYLPAYLGDLVKKEVDVLAKTLI